MNPESLLNPKEKYDSQRRTAFICVAIKPNKTSLELSDSQDEDRHMLARRLPELRRAGLIFNPKSRPCGKSSTTSPCYEWELTGQGKNLYRVMQRREKVT